MRVLVVDSDQAFLEILQSYMLRRGHPTEIATNGHECTAILRKFVPEVLVLADELLRGSDDGLLAMLSENPSLATPPAILIADDDSRSSLPQAINNRIFQSMCKPFWLGDLEASIEAAGSLANRPAAKPLGCRSTLVKNVATSSHVV